MKITLVADDVIRLEPTPGPLTIEAASAETQYSPFHMLASGLASCTFSVLYSWASHAKVPIEDLSLEVHWAFGEEPHRVSDMAVIFDWPSLPANRVAAARRVAELCTVHATLQHPPTIEIRPAGEVASHDHHHDADAAPPSAEGEPQPPAQAQADGAPPPPSRMSGTGYTP